MSARPSGLNGKQVWEAVHGLLQQRSAEDRPDAPPPTVKFTVELPQEWVLLAFWVSRRMADRRSGKEAPTGWTPDRIGDPDMRRAVHPVVRRHLEWALNGHFHAELHDLATGGSAWLRPRPEPVTPDSGKGDPGDGIPI